MNKKGAITKVGDQDTLSTISNVTNLLAIKDKKKPKQDLDLITKSTSVQITPQSLKN